MYITSNISDRIKALRFPLALGIVLIHAYGMSLNLRARIRTPIESSQLASFLENLISIVFSSAAVPLFFIIAGALFFQNYQPTKEWRRQKLQARIRTLLIPYLLWNCGQLFALLAAQNIPFTSVFFHSGNQPLLDYSAFGIIDAIFGFTREPINYPFWFIRDLMLMAILSPVFKWAIDKIPYIAMLGLGVMWIVPIDLPGAALVNEAVFFFFLGSLMSARKVDISLLDRQGKYVALVYVAILAPIDAVLHANGMEIYAVHKIIMVCGIISVWYVAAPVLRSGIGRWLLAVAPYSFMVYATHALILAVVQKAAFQWSSITGAWDIFGIYITSTFVAVAFALFVSVILRKYLPQIHSTLTGGR